MTAAQAESLMFALILIGTIFGAMGVNALLRGFKIHSPADKFEGLLTVAVGAVFISMGIAF